MGISSALGSSALLPAGLGFRNLLINGDMNIWQRGTSVAINTLGYTADRWYHQSYNGAVISQQPTSDSTRLPSTRYCARVQRNSGVSTANFMYFTQSMETSQSIKLAGQTATLSFWARAGSGMTSTTFTATIFYGTGIDQNLIAGYTGQATAFTQNVTLTTTWQKFVLTGNVPTTATEVAFVCGYTPVGTAGANDYFEITNVQLEANVQPTPFEQRPIGVELALCQRYYFRSTGGDTYQWIGFGSGTGATTIYFTIPLPVTMRTKPNLTGGGSLQIDDYNGQNISVTSVALQNAVQTPNAGKVSLGLASASTQYRFYNLQTNNNVNGYVEFGAEL